MTVFEPGPSFFGPKGNPTGSGGGIAGSEGAPNGHLLTAKCDFAEAIVYNTMLIDSQRLAIEGYLNAKYNIVTGVKEQQGNIPERLLLEQNYPNPFNPSTKIGFQITDYGFVLLKVSDVLGREVRTLVKEELKAGSYEVTFDAEGLASGLYFYTLEARDFVATKKLLLLR